MFLQLEQIIQKHAGSLDRIMENIIQALEKQPAKTPALRLKTSSNFIGVE